MKTISRLILFSCVSVFFVNAAVPKSGNIDIRNIPEEAKVLITNYENIVSGDHCHPATVNYQDCRSVCALVSGCEFWTYVGKNPVPKSGDVKNGCYLKGQYNLEPVYTKDYYSGNRVGSELFSDMNLYGGDLSC